MAYSSSNIVFRGGPNIYVDKMNFYQDCYDFSGFKNERKKRSASMKKNKQMKTSVQTGIDDYGDYKNFGQNTAVRGFLYNNYFGRNMVVWIRG